jgi:hypothetical protein
MENNISFPKIRRGISDLSWWSVLIMEKTGITDLTQVTEKLNHKAV